ncbi:hypothetical protein SynMITS9220_01096 [Synechococcus sp. MIT S9220]|nr:hypothetical protein SynMITS9220_01096 [Synechococcus sp. MIT S9220]
MPRNHGDPAPWVRKSLIPIERLSNYSWNLAIAPFAADMGSDLRRKK